MYNTLVDTETLHEHLEDPDWLIVDCRFDLARPEAGHQAWLEGHIPGAVYAHLEQDLSGPPLTDCGRHPLPAAAALRETFSRLGISNDSQVVVYDAAAGSMAARLWWLLRYMGHTRVALLDGGWPAWDDADLPQRPGQEQVRAARFQGTPQQDRLVLLDGIAAAALLIDSRDPARYRGDIEPIDPVGGHIPGAINRCWQENIGADGRFLPVDELADSLRDTLGQTPSMEAVFYCGSGVTACHNLLAVAHASLPMAKLYAGSWSEWCSDPARPVATGVGREHPLLQPDKDKKDERADGH